MRGNFVEAHTLPIRAEHELLRNSHAISQHDSRAQGFSPPLARRRSSCSPPSPNLVRTNPIEHYQVLRDRAPCLSRAATLPKGTKLELGRGNHLGTPSSGNHTAAASHPTGRIAKAASWLHLSRVSPALHPPERPSHTLAPKPGFGGIGHEELRYKALCFGVLLLFLRMLLLLLLSTVFCACTVMIFLVVVITRDF